MKTFMVSLLLISNIVGYEMIGVIPKDFIKESENPIIRQVIIKMWIDNIKSIMPHCEGATFDVFEDEEDNSLLNIFSECYKWGI